MIWRWVVFLGLLLQGAPASAKCWRLLGDVRDQLQDRGQIVSAAYEFAAGTDSRDVDVTEAFRRDPQLFSQVHVEYRGGARLTQRVRPQSTFPLQRVLRTLRYKSGMGARFQEHGAVVLEFADGDGQSFEFTSRQFAGIQIEHLLRWMENNSGLRDKSVKRVYFVHVHPPPEVASQRLGFASTHLISQPDIVAAAILRRRLFTQLNVHLGVPFHVMVLPSCMNCASVVLDALLPETLPFVTPSQW